MRLPVAFRVRLGGGRCLRVSAVFFRSVFFRLLRLSLGARCFFFLCVFFRLLRLVFLCIFFRLLHHPVGCVRWGVSVRGSVAAAAVAAAAVVSAVPPDVPADLKNSDDLIS